MNTLNLSHSWSEIPHVHFGLKGVYKICGYSNNERQSKGIWENIKTKNPSIEGFLQL